MNLKHTSIAPAILNIHPTNTENTIGHEANFSRIPSFLMFCVFFFRESVLKISHRNTKKSINV